MTSRASPSQIRHSMRIGMRLTAVAFVAVLSQSVAPAQQLLWKYVYDGSAHGSDEAWPMEMGLDQNLYAAGWSVGTGTGSDLTVVSVTLLGTERWVYRYNGPANSYDAAHAITLGPDGSVYAAGVSAGTRGSNDLVIVGLDSNGNQRWVYRYDGPAHGQDEARSLVLGDDGCLYAAGWSEGVGTGSDFTVVSVDTTGAERWVYRYDGPAHGDDEGSARIIAYGADGNIYAAGASEGANSGSDFTVISLTHLGQERWVYRYDGPGSGPDAAWRVVWSTDGNICAAGYTTGTGTGYDFTATSLTPAGQERWVYRKVTAGRDQAWGLAAGPQGMIYAGGELGYDPGDFVVAAIDSGGQEHWLYKYDGPVGGNDYVGPVNVGSDGNIYAAGKSYGGATDFDLLAVCLDPGGGERWLYRYNGPGNGFDNGEAIIHGVDGNTYVAGSITGSGTNQDLAVIGIGTTAQRDVGPTAILAPTGTVDSGAQVTPAVVVRNFGTSAAVFPTTLDIGSGYSRTLSETLAAGARDTVLFPDWTASLVGTIGVVCFTDLVGDENRANDTITDSVRALRVLSSDVGPTAVLVPSGTLDSSVQVTPTVVVRNFGTSSAVFPTTLTIGGGYSQMQSDTLAVGANDTIRFPTWTAEPVGKHAVMCFTGMAGDQYPANDTIRDTVRVRRLWDLDVGPVEILSPIGAVDSGSMCVPRAVVRNFGKVSAVFAVAMDIDGAYSQTVAETVDAGAADTTTFPSWTPMPKGTLGVTCFTALVGDQDPTNDTIRDSVRVVPHPRHDVGAIAIISPSGSVRARDTVIPKARIKNFGNTQERFFDVRFRIGGNYSRTANVANALLSDSTVELTFAPWVADSGTWAVSCSTTLTSDVDRSNDKVNSLVHVFAQSLAFEPDQSDQLEAGKSKTYRFYALIQGDTGAVVEVARPSDPTGWSLRLCDVTGANDLTDSDGDGMPDLGDVAPGESGWFSLDVTAPSSLVGDTTSLAGPTFLIAGHLGNDSLVADTAILNLTLMPAFSVHNFPNPFSDHTAFVIGLPDDGKATLTIYTRAGERVCRPLENTDEPAGMHVVRWDGVNDNGRGIAPGTYEYLLDYEHAGKTDRIRKRLVVTRK